MTTQLYPRELELLKEVAAGRLTDDANVSESDGRLLHGLWKRDYIEACPVEGSDAAVEALSLGRRGKEVLGIKPRETGYPVNPYDAEKGPISSTAATAYALGKVVYPLEVMKHREAAWAEGFKAAEDYILRRLGVPLKALSEATDLAVMKADLLTRGLTDVKPQE